MFIEELEQPLNKIKGLGPETLKALNSLGIFSMGDLLRHYPSRYEDRLNFYSLNEALKHEAIATVVTVSDHQYIEKGRERTLKVLVNDGTHEATLVCFGRNFLAEKLSPGKKIYLYASFSHKYNELQAGSFDFEDFSENPQNFGLLTAVYPLSNGLTQSRLRKAMEQALNYVPDNLETLLPPELIKNKEWFPAKKNILKAIHFPENMDVLDQARAFIIAEELYQFELQLQYKRLQQTKPVRAVRSLSLDLLKQVKARLPFELTKDQRQAIYDIVQDCARDHPMRRLLQGDVGSGKTLVGLLSACPFFEQKKQVALLAPTELLARQHAESADRLLRPLGIEVAFLTGNIRATGRKQVLQNLAAGTIDLIVGTHALFSDDVTYKDLSYVIVDEQHRFGVVQRSKLLNKGVSPDLLLMTATPIPRTLAMSNFGDLDFSSLQSMPQGRLPIKTHLAADKNEKKVYDFIYHQLAAGYQAYFVYPLIEQNDQQQLKDVEQMFARLKNEVFPDFRIGLIHGRLDEDQKRVTMEAFVKGKLSILVATSVVEVGLDVPNATTIVIEGAERFGLAALHQLRGRVGRGPYQSHCFFVYNHNLSEEGKERLKALYENLDGFAIADIDLKLRGAGELAGSRQSGETKFRMANFERDKTLLKEMAYWARKSLTEENSSAADNYQHLKKILAKNPSSH